MKKKIVAVLSLTLMVFALNVANAQKKVIVPEIKCPGYEADGKTGCWYQGTDCIMWPGC